MNAQLEDHGLKVKQTISASFDATIISIAGSVEPKSIEFERVQPFPLPLVKIKILVGRKKVRAFSWFQTAYPHRSEEGHIDYLLFYASQ